MKERGIIFNAEMVKAILSDRKTQTRRVMKVQPNSGVHHSALVKSGLEDGHARELACPFGEVGDCLWVRETFSVVPRTAYAASEGVQQIICPSDNHDAAIFRAEWERSTGGIRWRPSIHMPRWASRITLEITGVRVERLWDISEGDAKAEGCTFESLRFKPGTREVEEMGHTAVYQFGELWQSIYGEESWQANPWVWVVEFKHVDGEG